MATSLGQNSMASKARNSGRIRGSPRSRKNRKKDERERREKERLERIQKMSEELNEQLKDITQYRNNGIGTMV